MPQAFLRREELWEALEGDVVDSHHMRHPALCAERDDIVRAPGEIRIFREAREVKPLGEKIRGAVRNMQIHFGKLSLRKSEAAHQGLLLAERVREKHVFVPVVPLREFLQELKRIKGNSRHEGRIENSGIYKYFHI